MEQRGPLVTMKALLEAGLHFGHQTRRWNPKMKRYIFTKRNGIHIIDLQKTMVGLQRAYNYIVEAAAKGHSVIFVGTKKQAQHTIAEESERCAMPHVNQRWLGGTLTNFVTIRKRLEYMEELTQRRDSGEFELLPKKEAKVLQDKLAKLQRLLGGMRGVNKLPGALFVVDPRREHIAVVEANKLGIPVVAIVDTNCDPDTIDYPIPGNDDAIRGIRLIASKIADAIIEGQQRRESMLAEEIAGTGEGTPAAKGVLPEDEEDLDEDDE